MRFLLKLTVALLLLMTFNSIQAANDEAVAFHFADATNGVDVGMGKILYKGYCASCHGRNLQGQSLWELKDAFVGRRAPPHDASGHSWQHSDEALFQKTKIGNFEGISKESSHAFYPLLQEKEIIQIIAYIKARWPLGLRASQSTLNPNFEGMPEEARTTEWTFPPSCDYSKYQ
jgi:mono/diheme cytochrome c family protein